MKMFLRRLHTQVFHVAFDLRDNIFIGVMGNKLKRMRYGGCEGRDIDLPGIQQAYNIVLHPTGEKVLMLDYNKKISANIHELLFTM